MTIKISKSRIDLGGNRLDNALLKDYGEIKTAPAISAGTLTLDLSTGNVFEVALNANITAFTMSNPPPTGTACSLTLVFTADGTARTVAWGNSVAWPGGTAPTLTSTSGQKDFLSFYTSTGGATWYGFVVGQNFSPITSPVNTVAPTISGNAYVGQTLTAVNGTWTGTPVITYTYQWQQGTTNIGGATASTYVVEAAYIGETIRVVVTATNGIAPNSTANSANTAAVTIYTSQQAYTAAGTYSWTCPAGVTSVSVVCVGAGGTSGFYHPDSTHYSISGGGGGALAYTNNVTVVPGTVYDVYVGQGNNAGNPGLPSWFGSGICQANGGESGTDASNIGVLAVQSYMGRVIRAAREAREYMEQSRQPLVEETVVRVVIPALVETVVHLQVAAVRLGVVVLAAVAVLPQFGLTLIQEVELDC